MINYYEVLEVSEKASKEVIEKAHKTLAKKYHPDLNQDNLKEAEQKMKEINEAFEVLMDDSKRSNYDSILAKKREIEQRKASYSSQKTSSLNSNQQTTDDLNKQFNNYNKISYSNGYYTDPNDNFFINTKNMDEKTRKKLQNKLHKNIKPLWRISDTVVAGLVIKIDDDVIDLSVNTKLKSLSKNIR